MTVSTRATTLSALLLAALSPQPAQAQGAYKVGTRYEAFLNPTKRGSPQLFSQVYYPATQDGYQAPIIKRTGGLPVMVFMHGFSALGSSYVELAFDWARAGYVVVLQNTAVSDPPLQILDGIAVHPALVRENSTRGSFYENALDVGKIVLSGHSVGGANVLHILAQNPCYRAGFAWSPYAGPNGKYTDNVGPKVRVPVGIATATADIITPPAQHSQPIYATLKTNSVKFLYTFGKAGNHATLVSWLTSPPPAREVFVRSMLVARGLVEHVLFDDDGSLDDAIGLSARADKHFSSLQNDVEAPCYIKRGVDQLGGRALFQLVAPQGALGLHILGLGFANTPTPFGVLRIDTRFAIFPLTVTTQLAGGFSVYAHPVPTDPRMKGLRFPVQVLLAGPSGLSLSNDLEIAVPK